MVQPKCLNTVLTHGDVSASPWEAPPPPHRPLCSPTMSSPAPTGFQLLNCSESGPPPHLPQGTPGRDEGD